MTSAVFKQIIHLLAYVDSKKDNFKMSSGEQLHGIRHVMRQASHDPFSVDGKGQEPLALSDVAQIPTG